MQTILIPTIHDDIHAAAVAQVLEAMGHRPIRWFCSDLPQRCTASFATGNDAAMSISLASEGWQHRIDHVDVYWNRRIGEPIVDPALDPSDQEVALKESVQFVRGLLMTVSQSAFAVNDHGRAQAAENKVLQLHLARQMGFRLPPTLISNDPAAIRRFLGTHAAGGTVFKSFKPVSWVGKDQVADLYTAKVGLEALPHDEVLRASPSILQAYVPKAFEVRVTCMGAELIAAKLDSQATCDGTIDWRMADTRQMNVTPIELPPGLADQCHRLLKRLGLVFGCMDFIVTPSGDYVFLEVNQMGQFLWVEEACPEIPLLATFCEFLLSHDANFRRRPGGPAFRFEDQCQQATELLQEDRLVHLRPERYAHVVCE